MFQITIVITCNEWTNLQLKQVYEKDKFKLVLDVLVYTLENSAETLPFALCCGLEELKNGIKPMTSIVSVFGSDNDKNNNFPTITKVDTDNETTISTSCTNKDVKKPYP